MLLAGLAARFYQAYSYFLDPDEALHSLLAGYDSAALTYQATLTTAHPPLLILLLHYWRWLGQSEFVLRLPSVMAGTVSCWLIYLWLKKVTDESTAFIGLLLFSFAPALIELSAQVRQYAILNLFIVACLYFSECALQEDSPFFMNLSSLCLCGAVLTHYSAFFFVFSMGVYLLTRLYPWGNRKKLFAIWLGGQAVVAALCAFFLIFHIPRLRQAGIPQGIAETWLRRSIYHPGDGLLLFPARQTLRAFTYLFSHGLLGTLGLLVFLAGIGLLFRSRSAPTRGPSPRELALLIATPFVLNCALAIAGKYPYGGTRHNVYLASFAMTGISVRFSAWRVRRFEWKVGLIVLCLAVCNLFPAPPPLIRAKDHRKALMRDAVEALERSAPPGSTVFADYQSGLLLGYYACGHNIVQVFFPLEPFSRTNCGAYSVITRWPQTLHACGSLGVCEQWQFEAGELTPVLRDAVRRYEIPPGTVLWLFEAGFMSKDPAQVGAELPALGCQPRYFGSNIRLCSITVENNAGK